MKRFRYIFLLLFGLIGCTQPPITPEDETTDVVIASLLDRVGPEVKSAPLYRGLVLTDKQQGAAQTESRFAFRMLNALPNEKDLVLSPLSLSYALGLVQEATADEAASQVLDLLGFGAEESAAANAWFKLLLSDLPRLDTTVTLSLANAVLVDRKYGISPNYKAVAAQEYLALAEEMDFSDASVALRIINGWCSQHTNGLIPTLFKEGDLLGTAAILSNALYAKAAWYGVFSDAGNKPFTTSAGKTASLPFITKKALALPYVNTDTYTAVSHPLGQDGRYELIAILPHANCWDKTLQQLSSGEWDALRKGMQDQPVEVMLPQFKVENDLSFKNILQGFGVRGIFSTEMGMSRLLANQSRLPVGDIQQKAVFSLDKTGVEGAAVTAVLIATSTPDPQTPQYIPFTADRPFIFALSEKESGLVLFVGVFAGQN